MVLADLLVKVGTAAPVVAMPGIRIGDRRSLDVDATLVMTFAYMSA